MSEYQYYEFLAIDRPLDDDEQAAVRSLSSRARITATSFVNEYHWGDFQGSPNLLMDRYYDAHLYLANWGTRRVMLRLPRDLLDLEVVENFCVGDQVGAWVADEFVVLDLNSDSDPDEFDFCTEGLLPAIIGVRTELVAGDLRPLYLAWLSAYGAWERDKDVFDHDADEDLEPPVPPGLGALSEAQRALAEFLRLDEDLLASAARTSPPLLQQVADDAGLAAWVSRLPVDEKDKLLGRVVRGEAARVRMEMLRRFSDDTAQTPTAPTRRTVAELLDHAAARRSDRQHRLAARQAEDRAHQDHARAAARERRLDELAAEGDAAWSRTEALIDARKLAGYDAAVTVLTDLQALAERDGHHDRFKSRTTALRQQHARKPALIKRLDQAGI